MPGQYEIVNSTSIFKPFCVIWRSGKFVRSKGVYADEQQAKARVRQLKCALNRKARDQAMRDLGLVKVRGALGGTYYE